MFTDKDLKQLKDELLTDNSQIILSVKDGYALVARLEAAERVGLYAIDAPSCRYCVDNAIKSHNNECPFLKDLKAWRKSKGE